MPYGEEPDDEEFELLGAEDERTPDVVLSRFELLQVIVSRLYYSRLTTYVYGITLIVSALLLAITLGLDTPLRDQPGILSILDVLVNLMLVVEVALRWLLMGKGYLSTWSNRFDVFVAVLSSVFLYWKAPQADDAKQQQDVVFSDSLVMARIMVQFGRLYVVANSARRSKATDNAEGEIDFASIEE